MLLVHLSVHCTLSLYLWLILFLSLESFHVTHFQIHLKIECFTFFFFSKMELMRPDSVETMESVTFFFVVTQAYQCKSSTAQRTPEKVGAYFGWPRPP